MTLRYQATEAQVMLRESLEQMEPQIMDHLRTVCQLVGTEWPEDKLRAHTRRGMDRAVYWNLQTQQDILGFLILRHEFGERFDEFPAIRKALADDGQALDNRIAKLMLDLPMSIWDVVKRRTPPGPSLETRW